LLKLKPIKIDRI